MTVIIAVLLVLAILWLLRGLLRGQKKSLRQQWKLYGLLAGTVLLLLAVTKKWHVLSLLAAAIIPIFRQLAPLAVRFAPFLHQQFQRYRFQKSPPKHGTTHTHDSKQNQNPGENQDRTSASVTTALFHMHLDPQTGAISGTVRNGPFANQALDSLSLDSLKQVYQAAQNCKDDSLAVLEAYLQGRLGQDWQAQICDSQDGKRTDPPAGAPLTPEEAWEILGLQPGAAKADIIARHKSLIQKLHPDRGGSNYLTVRINQARDLLLKKTA